MFPFPLTWPDLKMSVADQNAQWIAPVANWLSPTIVTYEGDRRIEQRVVEEIASFGKQLGILTDALLEMADGGPAEAVERLRGIANRVEAIKHQSRRALEDKAEEAVLALLKVDPVAAKRLIAALEQKAALPPPAPRT
ncbi:hypothetical protein [Chthonobacter albigriseus]|uniref:hypothetical protein n=1 Tax=Chthonobacter albigriseus TaxID=1683161 RepID=UPI0015EE9BAF|nr:hypothetical protein [Chthonobacter albigriseus]